MEINDEIKEISEKVYQGLKKEYTYENFDRTHLYKILKKNQKKITKICDYYKLIQYSYGLYKLYSHYDFDNLIEIKINNNIFIYNKKYMDINDRIYKELSKINDNETYYIEEIDGDLWIV